MTITILRPIRSLILIGLCGSLVQAQNNTPTVAQIREAFNNLNLKRTIELSTRAIDRYETYGVDQLVQIYEYRAMAYFNLGSNQEAEAAFISALSLDSTLELDPVTVSPKIRKFFSEIKNSYAADQVRSAELSPGLASKYIIQEDMRPGAAWRSALVPGWGQHYKGEQLKGYVIFSGFILNSVGLITAIAYENSTRDAYLNAVQSNDIQVKFDEYEKWNTIRRILTGTGIIIWAYAFGDALWSPAPQPSTVSLQFSPAGISASIKF